MTKLSESEQKLLLRESEPNFRRKHTKALIGKLWSEARDEAQLEAQRKAAHEAAMQRLWSALSLPFDQALPVVREFINADFRLIMDKRIAQWCADNHKAVLAYAKANPEGK